MKKVLSFVLLLSALCMLRAQDDVTINYQGQTYGNGDTLAFTFDPTPFKPVMGISFHNNPASALTDLQVKVIETQSAGIEGLGLCTDVCTQDTVSRRFEIGAGEDYSFTMEMEIPDVCAGRTALYDFSIINGDNTITKTVLKITITGDPIVAINEAEASQLRAYPNPAAHQVVIETAQAQNGTLCLYDMSGRKVMEQPLNGQRCTLDLGTLAAGVYMYGIVSNNSCSPLQKLVVK